MDGGEEGSGVFGVVGGDATPAFEFQESVFHQMTQFIENFVVRSLVFSILLRRDNRVHALIGRLFKNSIRIVSPVSQQMISINSFYQAACLRTIRAGTFRNNNSDRHTMRIHGQMYLGVKPPFVRLMS